MTAKYAGRSAANVRLLTWFGAAVLAAGACSKKQTTALTIETAPVERRSIVLSVQANGTVEPVDIIEVKSKASGTITRMPVDIGSNVKTGDLLVQIDPRDVQNQYDQAAADVSSATVQRSTSLAQRNRSAELYKEKIITAQEMDQATLDFANADASLIKARTNLSIARVRLEDATVRAPSNGQLRNPPGRPRRRRARSDLRKRPLLQLQRRPPTISGGVMAHETATTGHRCHPADQRGDLVSACGGSGRHPSGRRGEDTALPCPARSARGERIRRRARGAARRPRRAASRRR